MHSSVQQPIEVSKCILLVDDDSEILQLLSDFFTKRGYKVSVAKDFEGALSAITDEQPDIAILDVMLSDGNGMDLCRIIREQHSTPIIMLTAVESDINRVMAYELGAVHYNTKLINTEVLLAQVRAALRKKQLQYGQHQGRYIKFGPWKLDIIERSLINKQGESRSLSTVEYQVLMFLIEKNCQAVSREEITSEVYNRNYSGFDRSVDITIARIRKKLETNSNPPIKFIKTIHNVGYIFTLNIEYE